jgi:hypothetical protein
LQLTGQVTFADLIVQNRFHLISPFVQAATAVNLGPGSALGAGIGIGNQVSFDLIPDKLQINVQAGLAAQWNSIGTSDASFSVVGQGALGATIQF